MTYEEQARSIKAAKLVEVFEIEGATVRQVRNLDALGWYAAAQLAGVISPSQATKDEVISRLQFRAELKANLPADPFAGFPVGVSE